MDTLNQSSANAANAVALEPEYYVPSIDEQSNYVDKVPPIVTPGIRCPCSKGTKLYETRAQFSAHIKTKIHQSWLHGLNLNKANLYADNIKKAAVIVSQQKIIAEQSNKIARLEHELHMTGQCLALHINRSTIPQPADDLLTFD